MLEVKEKHSHKQEHEHDHVPGHGFACHGEGGLLLLHVLYRRLGRRQGNPRQKARQKGREGKGTEGKGRQMGRYCGDFRLEM